MNIKFTAYCIGVVLVKNVADSRNDCKPFIILQTC